MPRILLDSSWSGDYFDINQVVVWSVFKDRRSRPLSMMDTFSGFLSYDVSEFYLVSTNLSEGTLTDTISKLHILLVLELSLSWCL
jgi:hypothetical protein